MVNDITDENNKELASNSSEKTEEETHQKENKQLKWAVFLMIVVILIIILVPIIINNLVSKFDYNGLDFIKTKQGNIIFYSTKIPLSGSNSLTGEVIIDKTIYGDYPIDFRNDPRKLDSVKVTFDPSNLTFIMNKTVYVTYNSSDPPCQHNVISAATLAKFLINFGDFKADGAVMNEDYAKENKIPYITCQNSPKNTVIRVVNGEEDKISKIDENCYELMYKECNDLQVSEKFILVYIDRYLSSVWDYKKK